MALILISGLLAVLTNAELEQLCDRLFAANTKLHAVLAGPAAQALAPADLTAVHAAFAENTELHGSICLELSRRSTRGFPAAPRPVPLTPAERARLEDAEYWAGTSDPVAELEEHGAVTPQQHLERECAGYRDGR